MSIAMAYRGCPPRDRSIPSFSSHPNLGWSFPPWSMSRQIRNPPAFFLPIPRLHCFTKISPKYSPFLNHCAALSSLVLPLILFSMKRKNDWDQVLELGQSSSEIFEIFFRLRAKIKSFMTMYGTFTEFIKLPNV